MRQPIETANSPAAELLVGKPIRNSKKPDSTSAIDPWPTIPLPTGNRTDKITGNYKSRIFNKLLIYIQYNRQRKRQKVTTPTAMEPLFPEANKHLSDLATDLVAKSNALAGRLHPVIQEGIGDLVRSMNCYYSNLIEGHHTHPVDIDKALAGDYSAERERRNLQLEARAHIDVQRKIDAGSGPQPSTSIEFIRWVHREFCKQLPEELLVVSDPKTGREEKVVPGDLRKTLVKVGQHIPPAPDGLAPLLDRFARNRFEPVVCFARPRPCDR